MKQQISWILSYIVLDWHGASAVQNLGYLTVKNNISLESGFLFHL